MERLEDVPKTLKEFMEIRNISVEKLHEDSKINIKFINDILEGKRAMPDYLMKILAVDSGEGFKFWKNLQNVELYKKNLEVGDRGELVKKEEL